MSDFFASPVVGLSDAEARIEDQEPPTEEVTYMAFSIRRAAVSQKRNPNHPHVFIAQALLTAYGFYDGAIDGEFGEETDAAVRVFQKEVLDRVPTGEVGGLEWSALEEAE